MESDLKTAEYNESKIKDTFDYNEYIDDFDYLYYRKKENIKNDPGSTKFKMIHLNKVTLETVVPEEPQEKHDKPNDSHYEKELERISNEIDNHNKNIDELYKKKEFEKSGKNPELMNLNKELTEYNAKIADLNAKIQKLEMQVEKPKSNEKKIRDEREKIEKELDYKNLERLTAAIEEIQERLGFGQITITEEKILLEKKKKLEAQIPGCKRLSEARDEQRKLRDENKVLFDDIKKLKKECKDLRDARTKIFDKKNKLKPLITENKNEVEEIKKQIFSIHEEIKKLENKYYEVNNEWTEKWRKFEDYMEVVTYIREVKKKQNDIRKREEKLKKKAEKDAKKEGTTTGEVEINIQKSDDTLDTKTCKDLISYFQATLPNKQNENSENANKQANLISDKLNEDLKKGLITVVDRDTLNSEQEIGISSGKEKKKEKGPKVSKRDQKTLNSNLLILGVDISAQIKSIGLNPPEKKSEVEAFIKVLEAKLEELKKQKPVEIPVNSQPPKTNEVKETKEAKKEGIEQK